MYRIRHATPPCVSAHMHVRIARATTAALVMLLGPVKSARDASARKRRATRSSGDSERHTPSLGGLRPRCRSQNHVDRCAFLATPCRRLTPRACRELRNPAWNGESRYHSYEARYGDYRTALDAGRVSSAAGGGASTRARTRRNGYSEGVTKGEAQRAAGRVCQPD